MIGEATLVPPTTFHPPQIRSELKMATPVFGSATAETSATLRIEQPASFCQLGLGSQIEQPLPGPSAGSVAPPHAVSLQPRALFALTSDVPPTAVTYGEAAG